MDGHNFTSDFMYDPERQIYFQRDEGANDTNAQWWSSSAHPLWYTAIGSGECARAVIASALQSSTCCRYQRSLLLVLNVPCKCADNTRRTKQPFSGRTPMHWS